MGASLFSGADYILDLVGFDDLVKTADAVVLGEGKLDSQSFLGKILGVATGRVHDRPVLAVVGTNALDPAESVAHGLADVWVATNPKGTSPKWKKPESLAHIARRIGILDWLSCQFYLGRSSTWLMSSSGEQLHHRMRNGLHNRCESFKLSARDICTGHR